MSTVKHYFGGDFANLGLILVSYTPNIAPDGRGTYDYVYSGTESAVGIAADRLRAMGATVRPEYAGGTAKLNASFNFQPNNGSANGPADSSAAPPATEIPVDRFDVTFGSVNLSLFALPKALAESKLYKSYEDGSFAQYKKVIQDLVDGGKTYNLGAAFPFGKIIYRSLSRGVETQQILRPTIRRTRTYSYKYAERRRVTFTDEVYKRETLFSLFKFPTDIDAVLPFEPPFDPEMVDSAWAYKITDQSLQYNQPNRSWEESVTWQYAAWDLGFYTLL